MKKLIFSLSALAALLLAGSCQRENLEPVQQGGTVTYTVQVPGALATKAVGDNELTYEVYRETQVSDETAKPIYEGTTTFSGNSVDLPLEFVKNQKFVVLFWAQKEGSKVYDIKDLRKVSISKAQKLTSNNFDAEVFAGNDLVENCASKKGGNVELVRPIAQLNIATDSEGLSLGTTPVELNKSYVKVTGLSATYNVYKGYGSTETANAVYGMTDVPTGTITVGTESYNYVAMNYIGFMPQSDITVDVDFTIQTSEGNINHTVSNVPVKANYKTNIIGNLITATDNYQVTLGAWATEVKNLLVVDSATGLKEAIDNAKEGEEITLTGDIDLSELFPVTKAAAALPIVIAEGKSVVLNLNGYTITTPLVDGSTTNHTYAFENHGELTIKDTKGEGEIVARGIFNYGKMTLESGTIKACDGNGGYGVRNYEGAEFVMNGGTVATIYEDGDIPGEGYDASPIRVDEGAKAVINGGIIDNVSNYTVAIDNYGETIVNAGTFTSVHTTLANSAVMTINGGSFTCNGLEGITAHALWAAEGTTTINGGTFDGKDNYNGFNVDASAGAVVNITGGKFLPVHSGSLYGEGTISVTGGEFFDDPAERVAEGFIAEKNGEVWVVAKAPVAQIGEVKYYTFQEAVEAAKDGDTITVLSNVELGDTKLTLPANSTLEIKEDVELKAISATNGATIVIEDGKTLTLNSFSFGSKDNATAEYEIKGGTVTASYGFFQHGKYTLRSNFETGYMYYSYGSDITVYGTFHSQGKGDGLDYVRGKLTIAKGGKSIHDKSLWVGQPASWGAMNASLVIEDGGYVQANSLCVYEGSSLTYYNNADLKYNSITTGGTITAPQQNNEIWYTATALVHAHFYKDKFGDGTDLVSNVWDETTGKGVITLSGPITKISGNAFYDRDALISISFPNSVTTIGDNNNSVFTGCPNLTTVKFGSNVQFIGYQAFSGCANLKNVVLPESLTTIGESAFNSCTALKTITIPAGVTSIGDFAFNGISDLKVYCKPSTPPTVGSTPFNKWWAEIYVPAASLTAYQEAWGSVCDNIYAE